MPSLSPSLNIELADALLMLSLMLSATGYIPQLLKLCREKSAKGVAVSTWMIWAICSTSIFAYAATQAYASVSYIPLACITLVSAVLSWCTITLIFYYRRLDAEHLYDMELIQEASFMYELEEFTNFAPMEKPRHLRLVKGGTADAPSSKPCH